MNQENTSSVNTSLLCFLAGAIAGAVVVALTTPKKGADLRGDISDLGRRAKRRAGDLAQQLKDVRDTAFHGKSGPGNRAEDAWEDLKQDAARVGSEVQQNMHDVAAELGR
jgi:gas vesicle protein